MVITLKEERKTLDRLRFWKKIVNTKRIKYSSRNHRTIHSTADVHLHSGQSNKQKISDDVRHDGFKHYPMSNITYRDVPDVEKSGSSRVQSAKTRSTLLFSLLIK